MLLFALAILQSVNEATKTNFKLIIGALVLIIILLFALARRK